MNVVLKSKLIRSRAILKNIRHSKSKTILMFSFTVSLSSSGKIPIFFVSRLLSIARI